MSDLIPRHLLFGNPVRTSFRISPDGRRLAWLAPVAGVLNVWVGPVDDPDSSLPVTDDTRRGITQYGWAYDGRHLLFVQDADGDENNHLYALDPETREKRDLTPIKGVAAHLAGASRLVRDRVLVAINDRDPRFHDLYSVEIATGDRTLVQENPGYAGFILDEHYRPHLAVQPKPDGSNEILRRAGEAWEPWLAFPFEDARTSGPENLDAAGAGVYCRDSRGRDTAALTRIELATGATELIAAHDEADIGAVLHDIVDHRPLAYAVTRERMRWHALDPALAEDIAYLDGIGIGDWQPTSRSEDDRLWVVTTDSDTRPWRTYLYDRTARALRDLGCARPELEAVPLAPMRPVTIHSRDGLGLVSYLTRPIGAEAPGPLIVLVHGGPWSRDGFGFSPMHQWIADRGYAALSVNFRASTGFGKTFLNAGDGEWGRRMDDDLLDALAWAVSEGVADPRRVAIMGGSYGGYAVLASMTRNPETWACGVDIVGPANLETLIRTMPPYWESARAQLHRAIGDPDDAAGLALIRERSPVYAAGRIRAPLLIAQGANDPRVPKAESDQMVAALDANGVPVTYLLFPDEGHGFVRPKNRLAFFAAAEAFLSRHLGGRSEPMGTGETEGSSMQVVREG